VSRRQPNQLRLDGRVAVVTGAGSGIGRSLAIVLARRGAHLALADINRTGLGEAAAAARALGVRVSAHVLDVAHREAVAAFPAEVLAHHPGIDLLVNNAGVAHGGTFEQLSESEFERVFDINFWGVVRMTRAFLPVLHRSDDAWIVNLSSVFGLISPPRQTAYSASKFAVRGFTQSLRLELEGTNIGMTTVCPGGVATSVARNAIVPGSKVDDVARGDRDKMQDKLKMPPERAAEAIVRAVEQRQPRLLIGLDAKFASLIERLAPVGHMLLYRRYIRT
jgi:NAD(P)-dependent dehydrogenase (short-subunit alcohol dehydrogenase family)